ncbi:MAG: tetratricopeptide repeat protein [Planctomycetota bacterium]
MKRRAIVVAVLLLTAACGKEDPKPAPGPAAAPATPEPESRPEPEPARDFAAEGYEHMRCGRREEARTSFEALLAANPDSADAHRVLASLDLAAGRKDDAAKHLDEALRISGPADERLGTQADGYQYVRLLVDRYVAGENDLRLVEEALAVLPDDDPASMILSDVRWAAGETEAAIRLLDAAAPDADLPMSACAGAVLLRLAVRRLQSGDAEGYAEAVARIPEGLPAHRVAGRLGEPTEAGAVVVAGRPASRPGVEEKTVSGLAFTADELDAVAVLRSGHVVILDRLVAGPLVPEMRPVVLWGYLPGLDAYLTDEVNYGAPPVLPAAVLRTGLLRVPDEKAAVAATGKVHGVAIDRALAALADGRVAEAWDGVDGHTDHPLARYVRARIAIVRGAGAEAVTLILGEEKRPLPGAAWSLAYGEALLANGEVGRALTVLKRAERKEGLRKGHALTRRVQALTLMKTDDDSETIAALEKLVADRPEYAAAWEDLAGLHLAAERFVEGREALVKLAAAVPGFAKLPRYLLARRKASAGLILEARTADLLMLLDETDEPELRRLAVRAAAKLPLQERRKALHHFLADPDMPARVLALRLLGMDGWSGSAEAVRPCLSDEKPEVRGEAARTYRLIRGREAAGRLVDLLADEAAYVREVAMEQLRAISGKRYGFDPQGPEDERATAAGKWRDWVKSLE